MSEEWYLLQFKPNSHHKAVRNLNQQGFETFLPLFDNTSRKASKFANVTQPLFPGYMFIKFDRVKHEWHKINNTYGVSRLVTFNTIIKSVPNEIIDNLMHRCNLSGKILPKEKLKKGDQVKVLKGAFTNFIASVETYESDHRIWILIDLMGRKTKIQTNIDALQESI